MHRPVVIAALLLIAPLSASASTLESARTIVLSDASTTNAYLTGTDVTVVVPLAGDLLAVGGTVSADGPVAGDAMLAGGTVRVEKPVAGDVRAAGGQIVVDAPVAGDLMLAGGSVIASSTARDTRIAGGTVSLTGANGPVIIYGSDVTLAGTFAGDVTVAASDRITIADGTRIKGTLRYNAPQEILVPASATVDGGASYIGTSSFLPSTEEARTFAVAGATILFIVHLAAVLILAGLMAGLFPEFTERVVARTITGRSVGSFVLLALLGFGILVATPFLLLILLVSFVGIGVALVLGALYALFLLLAYTYAGVIAGAALARQLLKRYVVTWKEAILGMLVLYLVGTLPVLGPIVKFVLMMAAGGAIAAIAYQHVFRRHEAELPHE